MCATQQNGCRSICTAQCLSWTKKQACFALARSRYGICLEIEGRKGRGRKKLGAEKIGQLVCDDDDLQKDEGARTDMTCASAAVHGTGTR